MKKTPVQRTPGQLLQAALDHQRRMKEMEQCGDLDRMSRLLSMAYETFSVANSYAEEATDIMDRYGLKLKNVKTKANNLMQSFDAFHKVLADIIHGKEEHDQLCDDYETLKHILDCFMLHNLEVKTGHYFKPTLFLPDKQ